jgi:hypothetical protein
MQVYNNSPRGVLKTALILAVVVFIAYLPASTFLFFIKNDAFSGYFPPKFFMSESLHSGYLPLWNPYINYGIPQYGDMSSGYWSPITWVIASTVGYNAYSFTIEILFYIFLGGLGVYQLLRHWNISRGIRTVAGISFICCGYNVGHLQHFNWLSGAAFLPWCMWGYLLAMKERNVRSMLIAAFCFYLFIASAHPGLIISAAYFFVAMAVFVFFSHKRDYNGRNFIAGFFTTNILLAVFLLLLSVGLIAGYADIIPHFSRGEKVALESSLREPTTTQSWISALLPFTTVKNDSFFHTDPSMRNVYFGLLPMACVISFVFRRKTAWQKFLAVSGIVFLLLSTGGIIKTIAYRFVPFIGYVRLNGEFIIFFILCFVIIAAIELQRCVDLKKYASLNRIMFLLLTLLFIAMIGGIATAVHYHDSIIFRISTAWKGAGMAGKLKGVIDGVSFWDTIWIQSAIQVFLLVTMTGALIMKQRKVLYYIAVLDVVLASLLNLPFTGVGKASVHDVQAVLNKSPKRIVVPQLRPIATYDSLTTEEKGLVGDWSFYSKRPGVIKEAPYPIKLKNASLYLDTLVSGNGVTYLQRPYVFLASGRGDSIAVDAFSSQSVTLAAKPVTNDTLVYQQTFYSHWHYTSNGIKAPVIPYGLSLMAAPVKQGEQQVTFSFEPKRVVTAMIISLCVLVLFLLLIIANPAFLRRSFFPSSPVTPPGP